MAFFRIQILTRLFVLHIKKIANTQGVNSSLTDGKHFLMFDFDNVELLRVWYELKKTQIKYNLPNIYIANTGKPDSYHAYCLKRVSFIESVQIALNCESIDRTFVRFMLFRNHATLRISEKNGRQINRIHTIESKIKEDVSVNEFTSYTKYETGNI